MASGSIDKTIRTGYTLRLDWTQQMLGGSNMSTVTVTAKLITASGYSIDAGSAEKAIRITVDGITKSGTCVIGHVYGGSTKNLWSASFDVTHDADGSKTVGITCVFDLNTTIAGSYYGTQIVSGSAVLTSISQTPTAPSTFTITAGNGNYYGVGDTLTASWSGAVGTITGYQTQWRYDGGAWSSSTNRTGTSFAESWGNAYLSGKQIQYRVRAMNGSNASNWKESNVLTISGAMDIRASGSWRKGSVWIKVNGTWRRAKKVWIKQNGTWVQSK